MFMRLLSRQSRYSQIFRYCSACYSTVQVLLLLLSPPPRPAVPTAPPISPSGSPVTSTLITLRWSPIPPEHLNGQLRFYLVDVTEVITNISWTFHSVQRGINIGPLHAYYTYRCRVAGFTVGLGPYTSLFYVNSGEACKFTMVRFTQLLHSYPMYPITFSIELCLALLLCVSIVPRSSGDFSYSAPSLESLLCDNIFWKFINIDTLSFPRP